jgi:hypothetical protein
LNVCLSNCDTQKSTVNRLHNSAQIFTIQCRRHGYADVAQTNGCDVAATATSFVARSAPPAAMNEALFGRNFAPRFAREMVESVHECARRRIDLMPSTASGST